MQSKAPERKRRLLWIKRVILGLVIGLFALALIGATYQAIATQIDKRTYPPPGKMVEVNGHLMHINCMGEGSPTVILETGNPGMSAEWANIQPQLAKTTRTCAYDRAGMGWSEMGPEPRDAKQISSELHTLLSNAGIEGPYVLAGYSFGGLYVRMYAEMYPKEVGGMVLVDSSHPEQFTRSAQWRAMYQQTRRLATIYPLLSRLGVIRLFNLVPIPSELPPKQREQIEAFSSSSRQMSTAAEEIRATPQTMAQVSSAKSLGNKPLAVITAGRQSGPGWPEMQEELAALSSDSIHRVVEGATHPSLVYERGGDAQETIMAILRVVKAVRTGEPLSR